MNINDINIDKLAYTKEYLDLDKLPKDKLEAMFVIQDKLRELFGVPIKSLDTKEGQKIARDMSYNVIQDLTALFSSCGSDNVQIEASYEVL